ncbi:MAG: hypothetical protein K2H89_08470 [Oscillospiraceae bacterium]|nr:hypothetical protein [Oscillospiraceae bacterium]
MGSEMGTRDSRVEVGAPILDPELQKQTVNLVQLCLMDNQKARIGQPDGSFQHIVPTQKMQIHAQELQYLMAAEKAGNK